MDPLQLLPVECWHCILTHSTTTHVAFVHSFFLECMIKLMPAQDWLLSATELDNSDLVRYLLTQHADLVLHSGTALLSCILNNKLNMCKLLVDLVPGLKETVTLADILSRRVYYQCWDTLAWFLQQPGIITEENCLKGENLYWLQELMLIMASESHPDSVESSFMQQQVLSKVPGATTRLFFCRAGILLNKCARYGHLGFIQCAATLPHTCRSDLAPSSTVFLTAVSYGQLAVVQWLQAHFNFLLFETLWPRKCDQRKHARVHRSAAQHDLLDMLRWLIETYGEYVGGTILDNALVWRFQ